MALSGTDLWVVLTVAAVAFCLMACLVVLAISIKEILEYLVSCGCCKEEEDDSMCSCCVPELLVIWPTGCCVFVCVSLIGLTVAGAVPNWGAYGGEALLSNQTAAETLVVAVNATDAADCTARCFPFACYGRESGWSCYATCSTADADLTCAGEATCLGSVCGDKATVGWTRPVSTVATFVVVAGVLVGTFGCALALSLAWDGLSLYACVPWIERGVRL